MPMTTEVWLSLMLQDVTLIKLLNTDREFTQRVYENHSRDHHHWWGKAIENTVDFPTVFYAMHHDSKIGNLPDLVKLGGYMCVSARLKSILSEFDLSGATLHPVQCFEYDRATPVAGDYYFLNFGRQFDVVISKKSQGLKKPYEDRDVYFISLKAYEAASSIPVCLKNSALPITDMWADPRLANSIFFSNRLVARLKKEKLDECFNLRACEISEQD
jgi:hypothetical protein